VEDKNITESFVLESSKIPKTERIIKTLPNATETWKRNESMKEQSETPQAMEDMII